MTTTTHRAGQHVATLHDASGAGILTVPSYGSDDHSGGHSSDWDSLIGDLFSIGWTPLADEWDLPIVVARLSDGGTAYALTATDSLNRADDADFDSAILGLLAGTEG